MTGASPSDSDAVTRVARSATLFTPWALRAAATLGLPDLVAEGVTELAELASRSGAEPGALRRLVRYLVLLEVFRAPAADRVELGELGAVLCNGHPAGLAKALDQREAFARRGDEAIASLPEAVRTGRSVWASLSGRGFWDDLAADPVLGRSFDEAMAAHAATLGPEVARGYDWSEVRHVTDVGGGSGHVLAAVLAAHPELTATLVDLPDTVRAADPVLRAAGVADRVTVVGGSFFDPLPGGTDVCLLANILHDWPDEAAVAILHRCRAAVNAGGQVVLVERVLGEVPDAGSGPGQFVASQRDLAMLLLLDAAERTEAQFARLGREAGLRPAGVVPLVQGQGLFLVRYDVG
ncbi:methyltransferase [Saccharopolyspora shandongensis]|uniref:methyltransferase n=1 Tax=Saccharopolyspora shandongensis TaxID=418495 RepID=UPI0033E98896